MVAGIRRNHHGSIGWPMAAMAKLIRKITIEVQMKSQNVTGNRSGIRSVEIAMALSIITACSEASMLLSIRFNFSARS